MSNKLYIQEIELFIFGSYQQAEKKKEKKTEERKNKEYQRSTIRYFYRKDIFE
jgi:hypothetical protein